MRVKESPYEPLRGIPSSPRTPGYDLPDRIRDTAGGFFVSLATFRAIADRIGTLEEIVAQNALTADDMPQAGWGVD